MRCGRETSCLAILTIRGRIGARGRAVVGRAADARLGSEGSDDDGGLERGGGEREDAARVLCKDDGLADAVAGELEVLGRADLRAAQDKGKRVEVSH